MVKSFPLHRSNLQEPRQVIRPIACLPSLLEECFEEVFPLRTASPTRFAFLDESAATPGRGEFPCSGDHAGSVWIHEPCNSNAHTPPYN
jgi:hypothetical protein